MTDPIVKVVAAALLCATERHREQLDAVRSLVLHARKISPGLGMVLYVADVEAALGMAPSGAGVPHKKGMNDE